MGGATLCAKCGKPIVGLYFVMGGEEYCHPCGKDGPEEVDA